MDFHEDIQLDGVSSSNGHYDSPLRHTNSTPSGTGARYRPRRQNSAPARDGWEQDILDQLPSRQIGRAGTLRFNRTIRAKKRATGLGQAIDQMDTAAIVDNLLQDEEFVEETPEKQTEEIRDLPTNLANKKSIKARIREADQKKHKKVGWWAHLRSSSFIAFRNFKTSLSELGYIFELWRGHLKVIEGKFGSGVKSYFTFMKWLLLLNIPVCIVLFSFVTIPQLLYRLSLDDPYHNDDNITFAGVEILTGAGWFRYTELYYGTYTNKTISTIDGAYYQMPLAYLLTVAAYYLITLIVLLYSLTKSYRKNFIQASDTLKFKFATKVFTGWDYAIVQDVDLKHHSLYIELREYISTVINRNEDARTSNEKCGVFFLRLFSNLFILGLIGGAGYLVHYISSTQALVFEEEDNTHGLELLALPAAISGLIFILPFIFAFISEHERYDDPRVGLYLTMFRITLLFYTVLGVSVQYWFTNVSGVECWENNLGETFYRLIIVDFIVILLVTFFSEFIRKLCAICIPKLKRPEFNIGRNTLYLIYSQILIWLGTYYSPLLTILAIFKLLVLFYVKRYSVTGNCRPSVRPWRGGQTHTVIMGLLGLSLLLSFIAVGYSVIKLSPSTGCGPYSHKEAAYQVISDKIDALAEENKVIASLIEFFTSSGFLAGIIIGLLILAYYSRIRANGLDEMVKSLKGQIANEIEYKKKLTKILHQQGPAVKNQGRRARDREGPISPGGRKFVKTAFGPSSGQPKRGAGAGGAGAKVAQRTATPPGAPPELPPRSPDNDYSAPGGPQQDQLSPSEGRDIYNDGFVEQSWEPDSYSAGPGVNMTYDDGSVNRRPNLPYSGQHYDLYRKDNP